MIEIRISHYDADKSESSAHPGRPEHNFEVVSDVKPVRVQEHHLGFPSHRPTSRWFLPRDGKFQYIGWNQPFSHCWLKIPPFSITCTNSNDGLMIVCVRVLPGGTDCRMTVLQKGQPAIEVKSYKRFEELPRYYMAIINPFQIVRIEEDS